MELTEAQREKYIEYVDLCEEDERGYRPIYEHAFKPGFLFNFAKFIKQANLPEDDELRICYESLKALATKKDYAKLFRDAELEDDQTIDDFVDGLESIQHILPLRFHLGGVNIETGLTLSKEENANLFKEWRKTYNFEFKDDEMMTLDDWKNLLKYDVYVSAYYDNKRGSATYFITVPEEDE